MKAKIEKGIPIPQRGTGGYKYDFAALKVGDSFWVPDDDHTRSAQSAACAYKKVHKAEGWNYTSKRETQNDVRGVRIWRTA